MAGLTRYDKYSPLGLGPHRDLPKDLQRIIEQRDNRWMEGRVLIDGRPAATNDDGSEIHRQFVWGKGIAEWKAAQAEQQQVPGRPGVRYWDRADGRTEYDLGDEKPELVNFGRETVENRERRLNTNYRDPSRLYGKDGTTLQGPEMVRHAPPRGFVGDPSTFPGARENRERQERARQVVQGAHGVMPAAEMDNRGHNLRFASEQAPALESGHPQYGDPKSFPSRDAWRSGGVGGANFNPAPTRKD